MTATAHLLVAVAASFAGTAAVVAVLQRRVRLLDRAVPFLAAAAAVGAGLADSHATALPWVDTAGRALIAAGATWLAASAPTWAVFAAAALVTAGRHWTGGVAGGVAVAMAATGTGTRGVKAAVGAVASVAAFHLAWPATPLATAALGAFAIGLLVVRRPPLLLTAAALAVIGAVSAAAAIAALDARSRIDQGVDTLRTGLSQGQNGDSEAAAASLQTARRDFAAARRSATAWWTKPALAMPVVGHHLRAVEAVATSGDEVAGAGIGLAQAIDPSRLTAADGRLPVDAVRALVRPAATAMAALDQAVSRVQWADSPWLLPPADDRLDDVLDRLDRAAAQSKSLFAVVRIAPGLLGGDGPRRYFLAIQTPSELRGSGGFIGNFGEVVADNGRLDLVRLGRTAQLNDGGNKAAKSLDGIADPDYLARYKRFDPARQWQNVTMSPHFPADAKAIVGLYPQSGGRPVDGVIAVDPYGLAALLEVVGPVTVPDWPEPVTAESAARVLLYEQYLVPKPARLDFLESVTDQVWRKLLAPGRDVTALARAAAPAVARKHIVLYSTDPGEQRFLEDLGAAGAMPPVLPGDDFLALVTQNAGPSKIDWFLRRSLDYRVEGDKATVTVTLRNEAPASGLPVYLIGNDFGLPPGTNKSYLSIYTPWGLDGADLNGAPIGMESEREQGRNVYSAFVTIPPGGTTRLTLRLDGVGPSETVEVFRQAAVWPDEVSVNGGPSIKLDRDTTVRR